jgi:hypothetical protein
MNARGIWLLWKAQAVPARISGGIACCDSTFNIQHVGLNTQNGECVQRAGVEWI